MGFYFYIHVHGILWDVYEMFFDFKKWHRQEGIYMDIWCMIMGVIKHCCKTLYKFLLSWDNSPKWWIFRYHVSFLEGIQCTAANVWGSGSMTLAPKAWEVLRSMIFHPTMRFPGKNREKGYSAAKLHGSIAQFISKSQASWASWLAKSGQKWWTVPFSRKNPVCLG